VVRAHSRATGIAEGNIIAAIITTQVAAKGLDRAEAHVHSVIPATEHDREVDQRGHHGFGTRGQS
jgi:hypothetical protein